MAYISQFMDSLFTSCGKRVLNFQELAKFDNFLKVRVWISGQSLTFIP